MARLIKNANNNYVNISNHLIRDDRLSWKARGIFAYLWSQADNWQFYVSEIAKHATDGKDSLSKGLKELEEFGYLKRSPRITQSGKMNGYDWFLSDLSVAVKDGSRENRSPINPSLSINNNKNYQQQEITTNKSNSKANIKHKGLGEYGNVYLSKEKLEKLKSEFPNDWEQWIERVDGYCQSTGKKYKDYLATIRNWAKKEKKSMTSKRYNHFEGEKEDTVYQDDLPF